MNNVLNRDFENLVTPFILKSGYRRAPGEFGFVFINPPFALIYQYEVRENATVWFGLLGNHVDLLFGDFSASTLIKDLHSIQAIASEA